MALTVFRCISVIAMFLLRRVFDIVFLSAFRRILLPLFLTPVVAVVLLRVLRLV